MRAFFREIWTLVKRELGIISGDGSIILTIFIAPMLYIFLLGTIYYHKDIQKVNLAIVDRDHSGLSRTYIRFINSTQKVRVKYMPETFDEAKDLFYKMDVFGVLIIPKGFEKDLMTLKGSGVNLILNNSRFLMSNEINKAVQKVSLMVGAGVRLKYFVETGNTPRQAMNLVMPVKPEVSFLNNIFSNYGYFLLPGLIFLIIQQTLLIGLGESVSLEREENLLPSLLKKDRPVFVAIAGKNAFYFVLYLAYSLLAFSTLFPFFSIPVKGDFWSLALLIVLFVSSMILFTNLLSSFFKKQIVFMEIVAFTSYPIFLITGYAFPQYALPALIKYLSYVLPTTPFMDSMIKISRQNAAFTFVLRDYLILALQVLVFYALLHWRWNFLQKKTTKSA